MQNQLNERHVHRKAKFGAVFWYALFLVTAASAEENVAITEWGKLENGEAVKLITLKQPGIEAKIATYGAQIVELNVDWGIEISNVVLGHPNLDAAVKGGTLGAVIGRYANRISGGGFSIDGKRYDLQSVNKKTNVHIHGGRTGFQRQNWEIEPDPVAVGFTDHPASITLRHLSEDGHEGYPGNVTVWVQYRVESKLSSFGGVSNPVGNFVMEFRAITDQATHLNLTNHAYFNLDGEGSIINHNLRLDCSKVLEFDEKRIPTGKVLSVDNSRFDYRRSTKVCREQSSATFKGLDHCYVVPKSGNVGNLSSSNLEREMRISTTQPGIQVYTANHFKGTPFPRFGAICFETQHYPDSPNQPDFPSTLLRPGNKLVETTTWKFIRRIQF